MARSADAIPRLAAATDGAFSAERLGRYARYLREAERDEWPFTIRRGGRQADHVQRHHLAHILLAMTADEAHEGPTSARRLRPLRSTVQTFAVGSSLRPDSEAAQRVLAQTKPIVAAESMLLGEWLEMVIEVSANASPEEHARLDRLQLWLSVSPARAEASWQLADNHTVTDIFSEPGAEAASRRTRRILVLPYPVIRAAGEVWADTVRAGRAIQPNTSSTTERLAHAE